MKKSQKTLEIIKEKIKSKAFRESYRKGIKDFTRERIINFTAIIIFQMNLQSKSLGVEIGRYIKQIGIESGKYSKQAYSKARMKLSHKAYIELNEELVENYYSDGEYKRYKGYRLIAVDGSKLRLPKTEEIIKAFGEVENNGKSIPMATSSVCYDVLNEINISADLSKCYASEREMFLEQVKKIKGKNKTSKDFYIVDRGYPSVKVLIELAKAHISYLIRVSAEGFISEIKEFSKSSSNDEEITINLEEKAKKGKRKNTESEISTITFRVVKIKLKTGETEYLITNVLKKEELSRENLKQIYHLRWNEETYFNLQKNVAEIENFSGKSEEAIKQDYYAKVLILNVASLIASEAQEKMDEEVKANKNLKYERYKVNKSILIGLLKDTIVDMLFNDETDVNYDYLITMAMKQKIPVIPNRSFERKKKIGNASHLFRRKSI